MGSWNSSPAWDCDGLDELRAHRPGWETKALIERPFRHDSPEHWYMGYRPSYLALRSVYGACEEIAALAMPWGYLRAATGT